jgi:hypothetical protein
MCWFCVDKGNMLLAQEYRISLLWSAMFNWFGLTFCLKTHLFFWVMFGVSLGPIGHNGKGLLILGPKSIELSWFCSARLVLLSWFIEKSPSLKSSQIYLAIRRPTNQNKNKLKLMGLMNADGPNHTNTLQDKNLLGPVCSI